MGNLNLSLLLDKKIVLLQEPDKKPPPDWPQEGKIEFVHATMRYSLDEEPVLKDLSFTVAAKEKVFYTFYCI